MNDSDIERLVAEFHRDVIDTTRKYTLIFVAVLILLTVALSIWWLS